MHTWRFMCGGIAAMMLILLGATSVAAAVIYGTNGNDQLYGTIRATTRSSASWAMT